MAMAMTSEIPTPSDAGGCGPRARPPTATDDSREPAPASTALDRCNVLLVYPRFSAHSFWNYQATCKVVGARYSAAPLGLITVAALLPAVWTLRLVDRNTDPLTPADLQWADLVMTGGMLPQRLDALRIVGLAHAAGKPVVVGGPDATSCPDFYADADFRVLGEAEEILDRFVADWCAGAVHGDYRADTFPDLTRSPVPRFDLLPLRNYMHVGVQLSRGCPFSCEFCNVIELNGRIPRVKTSAQMLREMEVLYALGYRGHVDFVDDNLTGNRKAIKPLLADLAAWLRRHNYPFEFSTEASIDIAEDDELLALMRKAGFFAIFVGIETPDANTLISTSKRQNTRRSIPASIGKIQQAGIFVNAGFILGFDGERGRVAEPMIACIEQSAIPVSMVGLLYALPRTRLARRLSREGRLHAPIDCPLGSSDADQCTSGLNFVTRRPRREVLEDYRTVLRSIYAPGAYFGRVRRLVRRLELSQHRIRRPLGGLLRDLRALARIGWSNGVLAREVRAPFWRAVGECLLHNPRALRTVLALAALYLHLRPFAAFMDGQIAERIAAGEGEEIALRAASGVAGGPTDIAREGQDR
jgi:radical SAM superfamily enzyme YgiQ (UPF0313 family)